MARDALREQECQRVLQAIRERKSGLELGLDLRGIARNAQAHRHECNTRRRPASCPAKVYENRWWRAGS